MPTPIEGYPYPPGNLTPNVPRDIQALAEAVETSLHVGLESTTAITPTAGWNIQLLLVKVGRHTDVVGYVATSSGTISVTTAPLTIGTITDTRFRPVRNLRFQVDFSGTQRALEVLISTAGVIQLRALAETTPQLVSTAAALFFDTRGWPNPS